MVETDVQCRARLPASAYDLAIRLGVKPNGTPADVRLTQAGCMRRSLDKPSQHHAALA